MSLSKYYAEICRIPILTEAEEVKLISIYKNPRSTEKQKQEAADHLVSANLRFAFKQAKYFSKNDPDTFEALIAAANEGLIVGLQKYDPGRGVKFLSYAGHWVKQRILKSMAGMRIVAVPILKQQLAARIAKFKDNSPVITMEALKEAFPKVSEKELRELSDTKYLTYYLDDLTEADLEFSLNRELDIDKELDLELIAGMVNDLPSPHKEVLVLSFGFEVRLDNGKEYSNSQIMKKLLITKDQLRELKKEGMEMIRKKLSADD